MPNSSFVLPVVVIFYFTLFGEMGAVIGLDDLGWAWGVSLGVCSLDLCRPHLLLTSFGPGKVVELSGGLGP